MRCAKLRPDCTRAVRSFSIAVVAVSSFPEGVVEFFLENKSPPPKEITIFMASTIDDVTF